MLVTNHVLSGAMIGHALRRPTAAFTAGVLSHLLLDSVPHWGVDRPIRELLHVAVPDGLIGAGVMGVITAATPAPRRGAVLAGMAGAALLDLDKPSMLFFGFSPFPPAVDDVHLRLQRESPRRMPQEVLVGLAGTLAVALLTRRARSR
ncbi:MAG: hypothetical protein WB441_03305 [Nocardioidaceae bacterium]